MKKRTFNFILLDLGLVGFVGYFFVENKLFLAGGMLFGVWVLVNLVEFLINKYSKKKPISMVKE